MPVATLVAVPLGALAFLADAALLLLAAQALLVLDPLARATVVVAATALVVTRARQVAAGNARCLVAALLPVPVRHARLAFAALLVADKALARIVACAVIFATLRQRTTLGPLAVPALFVAARLRLAHFRLPSLLLPSLLSLRLAAVGLLTGVGLLPGALGVGTTLGLMATGIPACFGLALLLAGALLRDVLSRIGLSTCLARATLGVLHLLAPGVLLVAAPVLGPWPLLDARVVLLFLRVGALTALVLAGDGGRSDAQDQDSGECHRTQERSGEQNFHVESPLSRACMAAARRPLCARGMNRL